MRPFLVLLLLGVSIVAVFADDAAAQTPGWTQATPAALWSGRNGHAAVVFNNRIWVLGGWQTVAPTYLNDVWSSADGVSWVQETAAAQWPGRAQFTASVFDNKIWVMGGWDGTRRQDVWSSPDGITWTQATLPGWTGRNGHCTMIHDNKMWTVAGVDTTLARKNDVWSTADGNVWAQQTAAAQFVGVSHGAGCSFDNRLWISGGLNANNEVWSSADGVTWVQATAAAQWTARYDHAMQGYNGRLWVLGGLAGTAVNDVWTSTDGITWTQEQLPGWVGRQSHATVVFDNKLWVLGGRSAGSIRLNDVWYYVESLPPNITSAPPTTGKVGDLFTYDVVATGTPTPVIGATGLPTWLSQVGDTLTGTPTAADLGQTPMITVTATNSAGFDDQNFQIDVEGIPPIITSAPPATATVGQLYTYTVTASGVPAPTFSAGALPSWLNFTAATGELSGTPTAADIGLTAPIDITADNGWPPNDVQSFQIDVQGVPPQITSTLPALTVTVGQTWSYTITGTGEPAPAPAVGGNPAWLTLTGNTLSGSPSSSDLGMTGNITVTLANGWLPDAMQTFQVEVIGTPPQFTSTPVTEAVPTRLYTYTATATGIPAPTLSVGALPSWLTFNPSTGLLTGTPTKTHEQTSVDITITAASGIQPDATQQFTIQVTKTPGANVKGSDSGSGCTTGGHSWSWLVALLPALALLRRREWA